MIRPMDLFIDSDDVVYVSEANHRISIFSLEGELPGALGRAVVPVGNFLSHSPGL